MPMLRRDLLALCVAAVCVAGCRPDPAASDAGSDGSPGEGRYRIVCTTGMVADLAAHVAGDRAEVVALFGPVDPHTYVPTTRDVARILEADVVLYSGLLLEGPTQSALERAGKKGKRVAAVTDGLSRDYLRYPEEFDSHPDPHVWNDVGGWIECTRYVVKILSEYDREGADEYQMNADTYIAELERLDEYARTAIASIPESSRHLITAHDAFGYFSEAYGIPVHSVQGITTASEVGSDDVVRLVDFVVKHRVPAVFVEETVNAANVKAVIAGARSRGWDVKIGGSLYSDSMGPAGTYEGTYAGMVDHNVTTIVRGLGGEAPPRGLNGKLRAAD